jgi:methyl acetate hydrolase
MGTQLQATVDAALADCVLANPGIPGVVAMVTDRKGTVCQGAAGVRAQGQQPAMTPDTVFALFSTTKSITGTAILQCVEEGLLDLDAPAKTYVPDIAMLQVIEGFDGAGQPKLRPPRRDITTRMLMLHTAGLSYDFASDVYQRLAKDHGQVGITTGQRAALFTPLLFEPGERWEYGSNIDWCGQIVEAVRGSRLGDVMAEHIFAPCGMTDTAFTMTPSMRERLAGMHHRAADGSLAHNPKFVLPQTPEIHMGGHGLYGTVGDYGRFMRMYLNDGMGDVARVLKPETVRMAEKNGLGDKKVSMLRSSNPALSNDAEFFPGQSKSWALSFMVNDEAAPTGRPAGSLSWAGLGNLYYWIDRKTGIAGFWATQILPFADHTAVSHYLKFETAVYSSYASA